MIVASNICQALNMIFTGTFLLYGSYAYTVSVSMSSFTLLALIHEWILIDVIVTKKITTACFYDQKYLY